MTERVPLTAIGIAICAVMIFVLAPRRLCACIHGPSKDTIALEQADHLAAHAADVWTRDRSCPRIDASDEVRDPWGTRYGISCSETGVTITSAGADGRFGTPDDITAGRR
ncbi:MAG TPA: hypothetical protein VGO00_21140 [Kofleriaceae bacterium]|jgi:hypothetical protein|nr:hypothetical protein [Kofleriaceae bacterium]